MQIIDEAMSGKPEIIQQLSNAQHDVYHYRIRTALIIPLISSRSKKCTTTVYPRGIRQTARLPVLSTVGRPLEPKKQNVMTMDQDAHSIRTLGRFVACLLVVVLLMTIATGCRSAGKARQLDDSATLYVGYVRTSFPTSYMPWQSRDGIAPTIASMIYSTLFSYDSTTGLYDPLIAERWCYADKEAIRSLQRTARLIMRPSPKHTQKKRYVRVEQTQVHGRPH